MYEARTVASLNHPHIITLYEIGDLDGQLFIAMELVEGGSLYQRLESDGPMEVEETIDLLAGVADALDYAHSKGLIHRDIKPANILLRSTHRNRREGVLTDFGLVKALSRSTQLTRSGTILGTLEYMAPEQIDSDLAEQIGPVTDIYALGIVAYQMLTGQAPFTGSTAQVMNGHLNKTPPSPAEIRSEVPVGVSDAILKAIAKNPADRYATATDFISALRDVDSAAALPVPVPEPKAPAQTTPAPEPTPLPVSSSTAVAVSRPAVSIPPADTPPPSAPTQPDPGKRSRLPLIIAAGAIIGLILIFAILRGTIFNQEDTIPADKKEYVVNPTEPGVIMEAVIGEMTATPTTPPTPTSDYTPTPDDPTPAAAATDVPTPTSQPTATATATLAPTTTPTPDPTAPKRSAVDGVVTLYVPAGEFIMGSTSEQKRDNEHPQHEVHLDAFSIDRTEVTNEMFARFVEETGYITDAEREGKGGLRPLQEGEKWYWKQGANWQHPRGDESNIIGLEQHPVVQVSWHDAVAYCEWAGRRLPTEAEWEKAARGEAGSIYPWGNGKVTGEKLNFADRNLSVAWADRNEDDSYQYTAPVGNYPAGMSPYGAMDMSGNVMEWVSDYYDEKRNDYRFAADVNPEGPDGGKGRRVRSTSWDHADDQSHAARRSWGKEEHRFDYLGFRCASTPNY